MMVFTGDSKKLLLPASIVCSYYKRLVWAGSRRWLPAAGYLPSWCDQYFIMRWLLQTRFAPQFLTGLDEKSLPAPAKVGIFEKHFFIFYGFCLRCGCRDNVLLAVLFSSAQTENNFETW